MIFSREEKERFIKACMKGDINNICTWIQPLVNFMLRTIVNENTFYSSWFMLVRSIMPQIRKNKIPKNFEIVVSGCRVI